MDVVGRVLVVWVWMPAAMLFGDLDPLMALFRSEEVDQEHVLSDHLVAGVGSVEQLGVDGVVKLVEGLLGFLASVAVIDAAPAPGVGVEDAFLAALSGRLGEPEKNCGP